MPFTIFRLGRVTMPNRMNGTLCSQNDLHRVFLCSNSIVLRMRCILKMFTSISVPLYTDAKLRKSTVLRLEMQNEGYIVRSSSGFGGLLKNLTCCNSLREGMIFI